VLTPLYIKFFVISKLRPIPGTIPFFESEKYADSKKDIFVIYFATFVPVSQDHFWRDK
jgi:hypothetical protein